MLFKKFKSKIIYTFDVFMLYGIMRYWNYVN